MKGRSNQSKMELDNASTTLTPTKKMEVSAQSSAIVESVEQGKVALTSINEAYTSKTVSWTGEVKKIGGSRTIKDSDGNQMNRDLNGARGIFLRALVDTPWLKSCLAI